MHDVTEGPGADAPGRRHTSVIWDWRAEVGHDGAPFWDDATDALDWALASIAARAVDAAEAGDPGALRAALSLALGGHVAWLDFDRLLGSAAIGGVS